MSFEKQFATETATDAGIKVLFSNDTSFSRDGTFIMEGRRSGKEALYNLNSQAKEPALKLREP